MDLDRFQEFMLQSAAKHDTEIAAIRESMKASDERHNAWIADINNSLKSLTNTVEHLVDNQVFLQESLEASVKQSREDHALTRASLRELERIVFRHVTDPDAHRPTQ